MTNEKIRNASDVFAGKMLLRANDIITEFRKNGMSEDDIIRTLTDAFNDREDVALDWYHAATNDDLLNTYKF